MLNRAKLIDTMHDWEQGRRQLKDLDWKYTPVYQLYCDFKGEYFQKYIQNVYPGIYTDVELQHHASILKSYSEETETKE
jgi:hypothetical protein